MTLGRLLLAASDGKRSPEEQASKAGTISHYAVLSVPRPGPFAGAAGVKAGIAAGLLPGEQFVPCLMSFVVFPAAVRAIGLQILAGPAVDAGIGIAAHLLTKKRPGRENVQRPRA